MGTRLGVGVVSTYGAETKRMVIERDKWCRRCGVAWSWPMLQIHHRKGRRIPNPHALGNLILLCRPCHEWLHSHNTAQSDGFRISKFETDDPEQVPYLDVSEGRCFITDDGDRLPILGGVA